MLSSRRKKIQSPKDKSKPLGHLPKPLSLAERSQSQSASPLDAALFRSSSPRALLNTKPSFKNITSLSETKTKASLCSSEFVSIESPSSISDVLQFDRDSTDSDNDNEGEDHEGEYDGGEDDGDDTNVLPKNIRELMNKQGLSPKNTQRPANIIRNYSEPNFNALQQRKSIPLTSSENSNIDMNNNNKIRNNKCNDRNRKTEHNLDGEIKYSLRTDGNAMSFRGENKNCTNYVTDAAKNSSNERKREMKRSQSVANKMGLRKHSRIRRDRKSNPSIIGHDSHDPHKNPSNLPNNGSNNYAKGVICSKQLQSEWDCIALSKDQRFVAIGGRNAMALISISEDGQFDNIRPIKASKKDAKLKYGATDAQFHPSEGSKLLSVTRKGSVNLIDFHMSTGRNCISAKHEMEQNINYKKVAWIGKYNCILAADDGNCYQWDVREKTVSQYKHLTNASALSVKVSPFNDNVFAVSLENGNVNIWDIRYYPQPFLSLSAHQSSSPCIDWHPAVPNVLASCGYRDVTMKIWNLSDDNVAQQRYGNLCSNSRSPFSLESIADDDSNNNNNRRIIGSTLTPNYSIYPSSHLLQIRWRPCKDPDALSTNQIACSYVGSEQVVDMWDITSSYVPVASLSSHNSQTKFEFMDRDRAFDNSCEPRTYLITCSKDKSVVLTDCGFADIPSATLSSCALDISAFGNTCYVSVERNKLHPFDPETYASLKRTPEMHAQVSAKKSNTQSPQSMSACNLHLQIPLNKSQRSMSGNFKNNKNQNIYNAGRRNSEADHCGKQNSLSPQTSGSTTPKKAGLWNSLFGRSNNVNQSINNDKSDDSLENHNNKINNVINVANDTNHINEMAQMSEVRMKQLSNLFEQTTDAFSQFETKLTCIQMSDVPNQISPCDSVETFRFLAKNYIFSGQSIPLICANNAAIATQIDYKELADLWNLLGILLKNVLQSSSSNNNNEKTNNSNNNVVNNNSNKFKSINNNINALNDTSDDNDWWMMPHLDNNNEDGLDQLSSASCSFLSSHDADYIESEPLQMLENALDFECDTNEQTLISFDEQSMVTAFIAEVLEENIDRGDIQTAVAIVMMLGKYIDQYLKEEDIADIVLSYIDMLLQDGLLSEAVDIYELSKGYPLIEQYFLFNVRRIMKCVRCKTIMNNNVCIKCRRYGVCSACNEKLTSNNDKKLKHPNLLMWCQICGHGGHFDHIKDRFANDKKCCFAQCNHQCQPVLIARPV